MNSRERFEAWLRAEWDAHYEKAWNGEIIPDFRLDPSLIWQAAEARAVRRCAEIVSTHQVPVGNSSAGELACEWTMDALREVRDAIRAEFPEAWK